MLKSSRRPSLRSLVTTLLVFALLGGGLYILALVFSPTIAPYIAPPATTIQAVKAPEQDKDRLIIPKIGVNIEYGASESSLDRGAWWRYSDRGTPDGKGNFIVAAHRFTIQPTPQSTIEKSPFFHIDKLVVGDKIYADYKGKRYEYQISELKTVQPTSVGIENPSETPKMTLYSCGLGGERSDRLVVIAQPVSEVIESSSDN